VVTICTARLTFNNSTFCPHSVFVCFVWIWEQTAIISLYNVKRLVFVMRFNPLQLSGHYMYHQFNIQQFYVLPAHCIYVFRVDLRTAIISLYSINWLVYNRDLTLYSPVGTTCTTDLTFNNSTFCPHSVFMCFVWIWEQRLFPYTALTDWYKTAI